MNLDPEGFYLAHPESGFLSKADNGTLKFEMTWKITKVADDDEWVALPGEEFWERMSPWSFSGKAEAYTLKKLEDVGFNGDYDYPKFSDEPHTIECVHREWEGKMYANWDFPWKGNASAPADDETKNVMATKWKNAHPEKVKTAGPPPQA